MTLDELSSKWQELRDKTLGRGGMESIVSPLLSSDVALDYQAFRAWLEAIALSPQTLMTRGGEGSAQLGRLRALISRAQLEGVAIDQPPTLLEQVEQGAQAIAAAGAVVRDVAIVALGGAAAYLLISLLKRSRSRSYV